MEKILKLANEFERKLLALASNEEWQNVMKQTVKNIVDETYAHFKLKPTPYQLELTWGPNAPFTVGQEPKPTMNVMFALKEPNTNQMLKKEIFRWLSWKLNHLTDRSVTGELPFVVNKPRIMLS